MTEHLSHVAMECMECPICGRSVEIEPEDAGRELACGHCRGRLGAPGGCSLHLADGWRGRSEAKAPEASPFQQGHRCRSDPGAHLQSEDAARAPITAVLAEHRDEVFARLATDLAERGMRVIRARTAAEAVRFAARYAAKLVVANIDLPGESGWLLAAKLRLVDSRAPVWLYKPAASSYDEGMARFLRVSPLIQYNGDLFDLSKAIVSRTSGAAQRASKLSSGASGATGRAAA